MVAPLFKRELAPRAPSGADARFERAVQRLDRISLLVGGPRGPHHSRVVRPMDVTSVRAAQFDQCQLGGYGALLSKLEFPPLQTLPLEAGMRLAPMRLCQNKIMADHGAVLIAHLRHRRGGGKTRTLRR
jgi:hypothetical protein